MSGPAPIWNRGMEQGALGGALLVGTPAVERLIVDVGLRPEHFYLTQHEHVFRAMLRLLDERRAIDTSTVLDRLQLAGTLDASGGSVLLDTLIGCAPAAGDTHTYAEVVVRDARRRARRLALLEADAAIEAGDEAAYARAEAKLIAAGNDDSSTWDREATRTHVFDWLSGREDAAILTPFPRINRLLFGGVRRGDTSLVAGWSSHGKSITVDQCLECAAEQGFTAHLYMNEMSLTSRALRTLAAMSGVPYGRLLARELDHRDHERVLRALEAGFPFGMSNVAGWRAPDICRHLRARRWGIAGLDSINLIPHRGTEEIDEISSLLCSAAQQADTHLLVVAQLNKARAESGMLPLPVERDVRESGKLVYDVANVLFVWREQQEVTIPTARGTVATGEIRRLNSGVLVLAKARQGELGREPVSLDPYRMRYAPTVEIPEAEAA